SGISSDTLCKRYDYPSAEQMKAQLNAKNTYLAILTPDDAKDVIEKWRWVNDDLLGNPPNFYQFIENDSSNILGAILTVIREVTDYVCALTTTTPEPTTPAPTVAPPTVATTPAPTVE